MTATANYKVRMADDQDLEELKRLMRMYIVDFYQAKEPDEGDLHEHITRLLRGEGGVQLVALAEDGGYAGFATLYFTYSTLRVKPIAIMNDLYVCEEARGRGAAELLFRACRDYAADHGYASMSWETARDNARAQRFYAKMGGEPGDWLTYSIELES